MLSLTRNSVSGASFIDVKHLHYFLLIAQMTSVIRDEIVLIPIFNAFYFYGRYLPIDNSLNKKYLFYNKPSLVIDKQCSRNFAINDYLMWLKMDVFNKFYVFNLVWFLCCFTLSCKQKNNSFIRFFDQFFLSPTLTCSNVIFR